MNRLFYFTLLFFCLIFSCSQEKKEPSADKVIYGGVIYTVNKNNDQVEAVAIRDGRIIAAGRKSEIDHLVGDSTTLIDLNGATMTPGFIEGHGHFMGLGFNELTLNLQDVKSYDELVAKVQSAVTKAKPGEWIIGRGWHQSKWDKMPENIVKGFQTHEKLSAVSPDNPVYLTHASSHAGFANQKAMEIAGVTALSKESMSAHEVEGGEVIRDEVGNPTGIFNETAMNLITQHIPDPTVEMNFKAFELAQQACFKNGITSFHDAGIDSLTLKLYHAVKDKRQLQIRMYAMLSGRQPELLEEWYKKGPEIDTVDNLLTIRSVKLHCDGALGSRGAWLLDEYTDRAGHYGMATIPMAYVKSTVDKSLQSGFQVCAHAIGDRANHEVLNIYDSAFQAYPKKSKDSRFRIEHAQHLAPNDIGRFAHLGVIPSMQAIHMSSDRPWAIERLGEKRIKEGAYMWHDLISSGAVLMNGTDVPVEPVNPIPCFYASVSRKTLKGEPEQGFEPKQKMTREEALRSYTINNAYGAFEENVKGTIEVGKLADFTIFSEDLLTVPESEILNIEVLKTIVNGEVVYEKEQ